MNDDTTAPKQGQAEAEQADAAALLDEHIKNQHPGMDGNLRRSLAKLGASIAIREAQEPRRRPDTAAQLPIWPETTRGTPNSFLRGALFAAIQGKERQALKREVLPSQKGITIRFTGWQLDQSDLDVWEQAAALARSHPLGNVCEFRIHAFLRALGRDTGKSQHEWLKGSLARLMAAGVEITHGKHTYGGSLLDFDRDDDLDFYQLRLNPKILALYEAGWTAVDWEVRHRLRRKPLALWLHGYLSSNAENYDTKLETLRELSGSRNPHPGSFKRQLICALADLEEVTGGNMKGEIIGGLVHFDRKPTATQARHIAKKSPRKLPQTPKKR